MRHTYPAKVVRFAQELHANGRSIDEIREACGKYGPTPAWSTVREWIDPDYRHRRIVRDRTRWRRLHPEQKPEEVSEIIARRMQQLRDAGLSFRSISAVVELDFGVTLDHERVRYAFNANGGSLPSTPRIASEMRRAVTA